MLEKAEFKENEEDVEYKISVPLATNEELERVMKSYDSLINKVMETVSHDKDILYLQAIIKEQHKRIEDLEEKIKDLERENDLLYYKIDKLMEENK